MGEVGRPNLAVEEELVGGGHRGNVVGGEEVEILDMEGVGRGRRMLWRGLKKVRMREEIMHGAGWSTVEECCSYSGRAAGAGGSADKRSGASAVKILQGILACVCWIDGIVGGCLVVLGRLVVVVVVLHAYFLFVGRRKWEW